MHRSGTSALTRVISLLGADLPQNLMPGAKDNNDTGFWESLDVYRLNEEILSVLGSGWDDWGQLDVDWMRYPGKEDFKAKARQILEHDFAGSSMFVLKDPRICRLLPFWVEVLQEFGARIVCLITFRNPVEVVKSLEKRDGMNRANAYALWLRYNLDAEMQTRDLTRAMVAYDRLMTNWKFTTDAIGQQLGIRWPRSNDDVAASVDKFLDPRHRHHVAADSVDQTLERLPVLVGTAYSALLDLRGAPGDPSLLAGFDALRAEFERAVGVFDGIMSLDEARRKAQVDSLNARIDELSRMVHEKEGRLSLMLSAAKGRQEQISILKRTIDARTEQIAKLEAGISARDRRIDARNEQIAKLEAGISARDRRISNRDKSIAGLDALRLRLGERAARIAVLERADRECRELLSRAEAQLAQLTARLDEERVEKTALSDLNRQFVKRLNSQQTSPSWQLAMPLRVAEGCCSRLMTRFMMLFRILWWTLSLRLGERLREQRQARRLMESGLFEEDWYIRKNPDVVLAGLEPIRHWITYGWREGRAPSSIVDKELLAAVDADSDPLDSVLESILSRYGNGSSVNLRKQP